MKLSPLYALTTLVVTGIFAAGAQPFSATGSMAGPRRYHQAVLLHDGRVLVTGGEYYPGVAASTAEIYNPVAGTWVSTKTPMLEPLGAGHTATVLKDGRVLLAGGGTVDSRDCEIYDPASDTFTSTGKLAVGRAGHQAALLRDGRVLVIGGYSTPNPTDHTAVEVYTPGTATWTTLGPYPGAADSGTSLTVLSDGSVLAAGGFHTSVYTGGTEVYRFLPSSNVWLPMTPLLSPWKNDFQVLPISGNRVMFLGGLEFGTNTPEIYSPFSGPTGSTQQSVVAPVSLGFRAVSLANGDAILTGGSYSCYTYAPCGQVSVDTAYYFNSTAQTWTSLPSMTEKRATHAATLLKDGRVLLSGGQSLLNAYLFIQWSGLASAETWGLPSSSNNQLNDDFNGSSLNNALWTPVLSPTNAGSIAQRNGRLEMTKTISATGYLGLQTKCKISGDFDVQVDFSLLNWPTQNYHTVRFAAMDLPQGPASLVGIYRNSYAGEGYQFRTASGVITDMPVNDLAGKMRLVRVGTIMSAYYWNGTAFISLGSAQTTTADTGFTLDFSSSTPSSPAGTSIAFDNFSVNSGKVICQSVPMLTVDKPSLTFTYTEGQAGPIPPQSFTVSSGGTALQFQATASTNPPGSSWLAVVPAAWDTGTNGTVIVQVSPGLKTGTYTGQIVVSSASASNSPKVVPITLTVGLPQYAPGTIVITATHPQATFSISPAIAGFPTTGPFPVTRSVPGGTYTVTFNAPVPKGGYTAPSVTQTINGDTKTFAGVYTLTPGSLVDTDGDGLPDEWELNGVFILGQLIDLHAMGANPFKKDIFVEVDWMRAITNNTVLHSHRPEQDSMDIVTCSFYNAPVSNPDGSTGIILHVDYGPDTVMNPVCVDPIAHRVVGPTWKTYSRANAITETNDLQVLGDWKPTTPTSPNTSDVPYDWTEFNNLVSSMTDGRPNFERFRVFHYSVFAHSLPPIGNGEHLLGFSRNPDGSGFSNGAGSFIISLNWGWPDGYGDRFTILEAVDFMHELGHNLGLTHGGIRDLRASRALAPLDFLNGKPNYLSIMNYLFSSDGLLATDLTTNGPRLDRIVDYSRVMVRALDESDLIEADGLGPSARDGATLYGTKWQCPVSGAYRSQTDARSDIDWNCSGPPINSQPLSGIVQINSKYDPTNAFLLYPGPAKDWDAIVFTGGGIGSQANASEPILTSSLEPTAEQLHALPANPVLPVTCIGDVNNDGAVDASDLRLIQGSFGSVNGDARYVVAADINHDGVINIFDLSAAAKNVAACKASKK